MNLGDFEVWAQKAVGVSCYSSVFHLMVKFTGRLHTSKKREQQFGISVSQAGFLIRNHENNNKYPQKEYRGTFRDLHFQRFIL